MPAVSQDRNKVVTLEHEGNTTKKMSHTVTVTRTTTTTSSTAILINSGYLKTFPGLLKLLEVIIGGIALTIMCIYNDSRYYNILAEQFFFCAITAVFMGSFCLFLSCLISFSTASIIAKTTYEFIFHLLAFLLIVAASITFLAELNDRSSRSHYYKQYMAAAILGAILSALYLISTILAHRSRGGL